MKGKIFFIAMFFLLATCSKNEPLLIGFSANLTGRASDVGVDARNGALLAVDEVNASGGVQGRPIKLLIRDDRNDAETAKKVDLELMDEGVVAIIGHIVSGMSLAVLPMINEKKMLLVSPTSVSNVFNSKEDYFIRLSPSTQGALFQMAQYAYDQGIRKAAFIYDLGNRGYSEDWMKNFSLKFEELGGKVLQRESFTSGNEAPFQEIVRRILNSRPDAAILVAGAVDAALLAQQIRKINPETPILIAGWAMTEDLIQHGGKAVEGALLAYNYDKDGKEPDYVQFQENFKKRFGTPPDFAAKYAYETVMALSEAMKEMKAISPELLKAKILEKKTFRGLQGVIEFDAHGDVVPRVMFFTVQQGEFKRIL